MIVFSVLPPDQHLWFMNFNYYYHCYTDEHLLTFLAFATYYFCNRSLIKLLVIVCTKNKKVPDDSNYVINKKWKPHLANISVFILWGSNMPSFVHFLSFLLLGIGVCCFRDKGTLDLDQVLSLLHPSCIGKAWLDTWSFCCYYSLHTYMHHNMNVYV